ncbi:aldose epimerase family protein [Terriglobus tenax]|uniref:aldose epimerase family protein n=1 Tax=Terriglobus tenax TaxID=1111115 RepID=UPI0021E09767|nr:aldose epimerase [Terriglobus tenax]
MNERCVLDNGLLQAVILPSEGGRVQSLRSPASGTEFLMQARQPRTQWTAAMNARFRDGSAAGIEECLPSVAPSSALTEGGEVPDHGDFWQMPWQLEEGATSHQAAIHAHGFSRPLWFRKKFTLHRHALSVRYTVLNTGKAPVSFLYACHPLLEVDAGDRIVLPSSTTSLHLYSSRNQRLGADHTMVTWPHHAGMDLSMVQPEHSGIAEMLYSGRMQEGWCGLYRAQSRCGIVLRFHPDELPYLGLWLCYGGWPDNQSGPLQYAVAPEPTFAPHGSLLEAQQHQVAPVLTPGATRGWTITFEATPGAMDFDAFVSHCQHPKETQNVETVPVPHARCGDRP